MQSDAATKDVHVTFILSDTTEKVFPGVLFVSHACCCKPLYPVSWCFFSHMHHLINSFFLFFAKIIHHARFVHPHGNSHTITMQMEIR